MWELDCEESWVPKTWCFWTVVLEKTLVSPLNCKEIQPVQFEGNHSWTFIGRTNAETPISWPPDVKNWLLGKDPDAGQDWKQEKGMTEDEMVGWYHWLNGHEFGWTLGVDDGQRGLACCILGVAKSRIWLSDWTELNWSFVITGFSGSSDGKESTCNAGDLGPILGSERSPLEKGMATHSSINA